MRHFLQALFLVTVGCLQMAGDVLGMPALKAAGSISHASPAPKVFTSQGGFETYSSEFLLSGWNAGDEPVALQLTPQLNKLVRGPYNRRNAYGAAISYGPVLARSPSTRSMFESVFVYAFCHERGVAREVGLAGKRYYAVEVVPRHLEGTTAQQVNVAGHWPTRFSVDCQTSKVSIKEAWHHG